MKAPPLLLGLTLLFWGWQTHLLGWAVGMAVLLEGSHLVKTRWDFSTTDLKRIWNLCAALLVGAGVIIYSSEETISIPLKFTQWLPFSFFPMILAQVYGSSQKVPLTVFSWFLRRSPESAWASKSINISFLYFGLCVLAASATTDTSPYFYPGIAALIGLGLMSIRPKRLPHPVWLALVAVVALVGNVGHQQLHELHSTVEGALARWFVSMFSRQVNLNESRTAIGRIGRINLSGNIAMRLQPEAGGKPPDLLRDASYDLYKQGVWRASQAEPYVSVPLDTNEVASFLPSKKLNFSVRIARYLNRGRGYLALPPGTYELTEFPAVLETNRLGWAKVSEGPGLLNIVAHYGPGSSADSGPEEADSHVPRSENRVIAEVAEELGLTDDSKTERQKMEIIHRFFQDNFIYSLKITAQHIDRSGEKTALGQFLTEARFGHCEYFATAAVLLLREAGLSARYATGYLVDESQRKGKTYVVRERDAHAWALVYRTNKMVWEDFDTTPGSAERLAQARPGAWEQIKDFFSNLKFQFSKWRWSKTSYTSYLKWLLVPLVLYLIWRIFSSQRRRKNKGGPILDPIWPGKDSEFYLFEQKMTGTGFGRQENEPLNHWQRRLSTKIEHPEQAEKIFDLHRRLRFDPNGVTPDDRELLRREVAQWLKDFDARKAALPAESGKARTLAS